MAATGRVPQPYPGDDGGLVELSMQQLINCDTWNRGCRGGFIHVHGVQIRLQQGAEPARGQGGSSPPTTAVYIESP